MVWSVVLWGFGVPSVLTVGDGRQFSRIEEAVAAANAGDTIDVYPAESGYKHTAVLIRTPGIRIVGHGWRTPGAASGQSGRIHAGEGPILIEGTGFDYSGEGRVPRAIIQVDPGADGVTIENLELAGAHNQSHNGAGVRINQAKDVKVVECDIHGNDMGVMSNGRQGDPEAAANQLFEDCRIHENGDKSDPGYNHNLYLGGTSATLRRCEVYRSLTGHNVKSRAHFTKIESCFIHDSANREVDLVEAWDTERPNSNAAIVNTVIQKDPRCGGNRTTVHFGAEKGIHNGSLWLVNDTIVTPFQSPVVGLSTKDVSVTFTNCIVINTSESRPELVGASNAADLTNARGSNNWFSQGYVLDGTSIEASTRYQSPERGDDLGYQGWVEPRRIRQYKAGPATYRDGTGLSQAWPDNGLIGGQGSSVRAKQ